MTIRFLCKTKQNSITTTVLVVVMLLLLVSSCGKEKKEIVEVAFDPETSFMMKTTDVAMLVSDSGVTRYRLNAKVWEMYTKAKDPYSYFPEGLYIEKFDTLFQIDASIKADTAWNYTKKHLWRLVGNVEIENLQGERFETSELFWNEDTQRIYSDKYVRIEQEDKIIIGNHGFESNQTMTKYRIFNSNAEFPVSEMPPADSTNVKTDSLKITEP